jgi:glycosyltransferase involved in cell wall biosynthesis
MPRTVLPHAATSSAPPIHSQVQEQEALHVALLTGADDKSYALGLTESLVDLGVKLDFIGSDSVDAPSLHRTPLVNFLNLRGDQSTDAPFAQKTLRILTYYFRLLVYAATAKPKLFHVLWNNKFEYFDRTVLMAYYRALGRRVVMTVHNVNAAKRDGRDSALNRLTLRAQYSLCDHLFVHTQGMRDDLCREFGISAKRISVIPFGINNTIPVSGMTHHEARRALGLGLAEKVALFFGQIAPYKGLEYLLDAVPLLAREVDAFRLLVAGKMKAGNDSYWRAIHERMTRPEVYPHLSARIEHIPDEEVERYFKASDVLIIPYTSIYQSGVPFLAYSFGLPVIATDVGMLRNDIIEGVTGMICPPRNPDAIVRAMTAFFCGEMYRKRDSLNQTIRQVANERHSWTTVASITVDVYKNVSGNLLRNRSPER